MQNFPEPWVPQLGQVVVARCVMGREVMGRKPHRTGGNTDTRVRRIPIDTIRIVAVTFLA